MTGWLQLPGIYFPGELIAGRLLLDNCPVWSLVLSHVEVGRLEAVSSLVLFASRLVALVYFGFFHAAAVWIIRELSRGPLPTNYLGTFNKA